MSVERPRDGGESVTVRLYHLSRTSLRGRIELGKREFLDTDEEYDEIRGSLDLTRRLSRRFTVTVGAYYEERDSDEIAESSYDEWVGRISLTYRVFGEDLR